MTGNEVFVMLNKRTVKEYLIITGGTIVIAAAVYFFMLPSHVTVGSATALALVMTNFIPLPVSVITFALNVILLVIGFLLIGPEFGAKTVYSSILLPVIIGVFEIIFPDFQSITGDPLLDVVCYILVVGLGLSLLFSCNAASGGLDIVAKLMNKYLRMDLGQAMSLSGILVALTSALVYEKDIVVLSVLGTYFGGLVVDHFIFGLNIKRRVCIISPKIDEILPFVLHDLHSGATINEIIGAYDNTPRKELIVIVDKQEYKKLMDFVKRTDPGAFITVYSVNEISYTPKK
jgi:uncharacterized membrane-anchored protein YitT (DUF2179 family)